MIKELVLPLNLGISLHVTPYALLLLFVSVDVQVYLYTTCNQHYKCGFSPLLKLPCPSRWTHYF